MACLHDHSCEDHNCAADWSLYNHVDIPKVPFVFDELVIFHCYHAAFRIAQRDSGL